MHHACMYVFGCPMITTGILLTHRNQDPSSLISLRDSCVHACMPTNKEYFNGVSQNIYQ